jgi:hypothetical protein
VGVRAHRGLKQLHPELDVALDVTAGATWADRTFTLSA